VPDADGIDRDFGVGGEPACCPAPGIAVLAGDEQDRPGATSSRNARWLPSSLSIQALGSGAPGRVDGSQTRMSATGDGAGVTVVHAP
jgi:hypothetical protein